MRTFRILVGASFLFFCTTLMHAGHMGMQDPLCSNGTPGAVEVDGTSFSFSANANGTSTSPNSQTLQYLCFFNASGVTWNNILVTVDPSDSGTPVLASSVFCDSPTNSLGTAYTCQVNSDANGDLTSIFFFAQQGQTGIPYLSNLLIDLNPCGVRGEVCNGNGDAGTTPWPANFAFDAVANVPEPTSIALLGTGLLVTFRKRLLKSKS